MTEQMKKRVDRHFARIHDILKEQETYIAPDRSVICPDPDPELIGYILQNAEILQQHVQRTSQYAKQAYIANIQAAIDCLKAAAKYSPAIPSDMPWIDIGNEETRSPYGLAEFLRIHLEMNEPYIAPYEDN